jgi:4-hydroxybutyrate CoA-transferase
VLAPRVIVQMPRTFGDGQVHLSHLDFVVYSDDPLPELSEKNPSAEEMQIGQIISERLVQDGATLQMGIGSIPDAVLRSLGDHRELGIHSEMFSDGVIDLVRTGVITNSRKVLDPGQLVGGFCIGSRRLYDFLDNNPMVRMKDIAYVNDTSVIRQQPKMTAINSCIEIDLTGQVVSDSIGTRIYSGVGGQLDFIRGASLCPDGVPILAMPSTTKQGESRIVPFCKPGGGVVTTRAHVHNVVTEYGAVDLFGKTLQERARALISIAHPDHREELERAAVERLKRL